MKVPAAVFSDFEWVTFHTDEKPACVHTNACEAAGTILTPSPLVFSNAPEAWRQRTAAESNVR